MENEVIDTLNVVIEKIDDLTTRFHEHDDLARTICDDVASLKNAQIQNLEFQKTMQATVCNIAKSQERTQNQLEQFVSVNAAAEAKREEFYQKELSRKNAREFVITKKKLAIYATLVGIFATIAGAVAALLA